MSTIVGAGGQREVKAEGDEVVPEAVRAIQNQKDYRAREEAVPDVRRLFARMRAVPDASVSRGGS